MGIYPPKNNNRFQQGFYSVSGILLLGKHGQLGWELHRALLPLGHVTALDVPDIDLRRPESLVSLIDELRPSVIINATAYTAVDRAESEPELAMAVNGRAPGVLAEAARSVGAGIIHISTDYVFDGTKDGAYTEDDNPNPLGVYAHSKLVGEQSTAAVGGAWLVLRTAWLYTLRRESFVTKVLGWSRRQPELRIVTDQVGNPTWARSLADLIAQVIAKSGPDPAGWIGERGGLYHVASGGAASRFEWAQAILRYDPHPEEQVTTHILPALTADFPTPARRPLNTALNCDRFEAVFGLRLPDWDEMLSLALQLD